MTLLTIAGLIAKQQSPYSDTPPITLSDFIRIFDMEQIIFDAQHQATRMIEESIRKMILKTFIDHFSLPKGKIDDLFRAIMSTDIDSSPLKS